MEGRRYIWRDLGIERREEGEAGREGFVFIENGFNRNRGLPPTRQPVTPPLPPAHCLSLLPAKSVISCF